MASTSTSKPFPYLLDAGITINIDSIKVVLNEINDHNNDDLHIVTRLSDTQTISNGIMADACKVLDDVGITSWEKSIAFFRCLLPNELANSLNPNTFIPGKIKPFRKKLQAQRKQRSRYPAKFANFMAEEFRFEVRTYAQLTPRSHKRKAETTLRETKRRLTGDLVTLQEKFSENIEEGYEREVKEAQFRKELQEKEKEIEVRREEHKNLSDQFATMQEQQSSELSLKRRISGMRSAESRRKAKEYATLSSPPPPTPTDIHHKVDAAIQDKKDIIIIDQQSHDHVLEGKLYHSEPSSRKATSGQVYSFLKLEQNAKPCTEIGKRQLRNRSKLLDHATELIAGGSTEEQKEALLTQMARSNKELFQRVLENVGFHIQGKMTPLVGLQIQSMLRLTTYGCRNLRRALNNLGLNVLPSERGMIKEKVQQVSHVSSQNVESGTMGLHKTKDAKEVTPCAFVRVRYLPKFFETIIAKDKSGFLEDERFGGKLWILFAGDKGGNHMKFYGEVVNSKIGGSVDNVHLYCMFEAVDSSLNMRKVWLPFKSQVEEMMEPGFKLDGREIEIFLGGDIQFKDETSGHQGSSSLYPSSIDYVHLHHLQQHGGKPHTPETCGADIPLRTVEEYKLYYNANLAANKNTEDMHKHGKHYYNVAEPMIFPLKTLDNVVPASLHINLGITLLLYNILLKKCKDLDEQDVGSAKKEKQRLDCDYEIASLEVADIQRNLEAHGVNIVVMLNRLHRLEAVMAKDYEENLKTAQLSDNRRLPKRKNKKSEEVEKCNAGEESGDNCCFVTEYDIDVTMVQCDRCDHWLHAMCDTVLPSSEITLSEDEYICAQCTSQEISNENVDRVLLFQEKIAALIEEEDGINEKLVDATRVADDLKSKYETTMGEREKMLVEALENMHVKRQAYHGNVFVGNHCLVVLERHQELTKVIIDHPTSALLNQVFEIFNKAMKYMMAPRFLDGDEIKTLVELCTMFGRIFPVSFPDRSITRKIHEFVFNVPRFVQRWKTIGMFSEQEGESIHHSVKAELRSLTSVRSHSERIRLVMEKQELRSNVDKSLFNPKPRLCQLCPERVFLRAGRDKAKHCPKCESGCF